MLPLAYYLLKVIACSGVFCLYYLIALRNKHFHTWNRLYLLAATILSLILPLALISIYHDPGKSQIQLIQLLQIVNSGNVPLHEYHGYTGDSAVNVEYIAILTYCVISSYLLTIVANTVYKIMRLKAGFDTRDLNGIRFINTNAPGTPFSFFNNIFWNSKIDINTPSGRRILDHEIVHVQQGHSYDKLFMNLVIALFWINPFFRLMRKELNVIHEFSADEQSIADFDAAAFAAMILHTTYPTRPTFTNAFFHSPIKRRLAMLKKQKDGKVSYASRAFTLLLVLLLFFSFTVKLKPVKLNGYSGKPVTVIIDAGHGGTDNGAVGKDGVYEKDLTLAIAKKILELNRSNSINIVLSRKEDESIGPRQRVDLATSLNADLMVSIHLDAESVKNSNSGLNILIPADENNYLKESKLLGSGINQSFKNNYELPVATELKQPGQGVWLLKANRYPAVIVSPGYISNENDVRYLQQSPNQYTIAKNILEGISKYAQQRSPIEK